MTILIQTQQLQCYRYLSNLLSEHVLTDCLI